MAREHLLKQRIYNSAFAGRGRNDVVMVEAIPVADGERISIVFESADSPWQQGIWLMTDRGMLINGVSCPKAMLWKDTAPPEVMIECRTSDGVLSFYNIWDDGNGMRSQAWSSGMLVEDLPDGARYRCSDIGFETDFSRLVFRIRRVP